MTNPAFRNTRVSVVAGVVALLAAMPGEAHAQAQGAPPAAAPGGPAAGGAPGAKAGVSAPSVAPDARREQDLARIQAMRGSPYWERVMQLQDALYIVQLERQIAEEASKKADAEAAFTQTLRGQIGESGGGVMFNTTPDMSLLRRDSTSMSGPSVMGVSPPGAPAPGVQTTPLFATAPAPAGAMAPAPGSTGAIDAGALPAGQPSSGFPTTSSAPMPSAIPATPPAKAPKTSEPAASEKKPVVSGIYGSGEVLQAEIVWDGKVAFYRPGQTIIGSGGWMVSEIVGNEVVARDPKGRKVVLASQ